MILKVSANGGVSPEGRESHSETLSCDQMTARLSAVVFRHEDMMNRQNLWLPESKPLFIHYAGENRGERVVPRLLTPTL